MIDEPEAGNAAAKDEYIGFERWCGSLCHNVWVAFEALALCYHERQLMSETIP